jgi:hypothetical protein
MRQPSVISLVIPVFLAALATTAAITLMPEPLGTLFLGGALIGAILKSATPTKDHR